METITGAKTIIGAVYNILSTLASIPPAFLIPAGWFLIVAGAVNFAFGLAHDNHQKGKRKFIDGLLFVISGAVFAFVHDYPVLTGFFIFLVVLSILIRIFGEIWVWIFWHWHW